MSEEQMDEVQRWIGDAVARNLKTLAWGLYSMISLLVVGTAFLADIWLEMKAGMKTAAESKTTLETQVLPVLTNHEIRMGVLEFAGGIHPTVPVKGGTPNK